LTDGHARRRPAVSEKDKLHRRDEIMVAAKKVFAHNGFHATTIADIAKEPGLAYGSVYQYFDSKEELFDALMAAQEYALRTHLAVAMAATGARPDESWEPLRATAQATFEFFEADRATAKLVFRDAYALTALIGQMAHRRLITDDGVTAAEAADFIVSLVFKGLRPNRS
jgi:AcrR family transcriptional regulator